MYVCICVLENPLCVKSNFSKASKSHIIVQTSKQKKLAQLKYKKAINSLYCTFYIVF